MGTARVHCGVACTDGQWFIEDLRSACGTFVEHQRISGKRPIAHGERLVIPSVARFELFRRTRLLDHIVVAGSWTLYGFDRPLSPGVWPALRFAGGALVRGTAIVRPPFRPLRPAIVPDAREVVGPFVIDVYPDVGGIPLAAFPKPDRLDASIAAQILDQTAGRDADEGEVIVDFDGRVHVIPAVRNHRHQPLPILRERASFARPGPRTREDLASTVRGLFPEAWALEDQLRDELAVLTPDVLQRWRDAAVAATTGSG